MVLIAQSTSDEVRKRVRASANMSARDGLHQLVFRAMSTECRISVSRTTDAQATDFWEQALEWVANFEAKYSRFLEDSLVGQINQAAGERWVELDAEAERLLGLCHELFFYSRGAFDPTALPLIKLWNWKATPPVLPSCEAIERARELVGWNKVQRRAGGVFLPRKGMSIDLGGVGKEYAVDCVANLARECGLNNVLVDFGRDVRVFGQGAAQPHWRIGLEDATNPGRCWVGLALCDQGVATSGDYVRHFVIDGKRYSHLIDPRTGYPVDNEVRGASIIAPTCTIAGFYSTTACIVGAKEALRLVESYPGAAGAITTDTTKVFTRTFHEYVARN